MKYASHGNEYFECNGIMITHPDADHVHGVTELFERFPPNQAIPHQPKFILRGPLLVTKAFLHYQN